MRQGVLVVFVVVMVVAIFAFAPYIIPQPPRSLETFSERQMFVTTGIISWVDGSGAQHYQWDTTFRSVTAVAVSIRAELNLSSASAPISETKFMVGLALIGTNDPLDYNVTATMNTMDLAPPAQGFFHIGQSFPEVVSVTFLNGTSTQLFVSAQVIEGPNYET